MNLHLLTAEELIATQLFSPYDYLNPAAGYPWVFLVTHVPRAGGQGKGASLFAFKSEICSILPLSSFNFTSWRPSFSSKATPAPWRPSDDTFSRGLLS